MHKQERTDLRIIKTARDKESINKAAQEGYRPLVKPVIPSKEIQRKICVMQNVKTGEIVVVGDYRGQTYMSQGHEMVIDWTRYYPYNFPNPYAAYLIPTDIKIGERVMLEDLIEDYVSGTWNQGDAYRLERCEAIWNGKDFDILYDQSLDVSHMIG